MEIHGTKNFIGDSPGNQTLIGELPRKPKKISSPYAVVFVENCIRSVGGILFVILLRVTAVPRHMPHLSAIETPDRLRCSCIQRHILRILLLLVARSRSPSFFVNKRTRYIGNG